MAGLEPARLATGDFESPVYTNFTTSALDKHRMDTYRMNYLGCIMRVAGPPGISPLSVAMVGLISARMPSSISSTRP
jgi:hypothetical protein